MDHETRRSMKLLGFTQAEIDAVAKEWKELEGLHKSPPEKAPSAAALRQRRYQARKDARRSAGPLPAWARKRKAS